MSRKPKLGPTGEFPEGKRSPDDEGAVNIGISRPMKNGEDLCNEAYQLQDLIADNGGKIEEYIWWMNLATYRKLFEYMATLGQSFPTTEHRYMMIGMEARVSPIMLPDLILPLPRSAHGDLIPGRLNHPIYRQRNRA